MKYKDESGQWKDLVLPATGDTLPVGTVVEFEGDTVPSNWEKVEENNIVTGGPAVKCGYKIDGKDVYAKRFVLGNGVAQGQSYDYSLVPFGIDCSLVDIENYVCKTSDGETLPILTNDEYTVYGWLQSNNSFFRVRNGSQANLSNTKLILTVYFTNKEQEV